jgi:hypothetical protein
MEMRKMEMRKMEMRKMENNVTKNDVKVDEKGQEKRYYVDFYDMFDGWGTFGFFTDRLFEELDSAIKLCDELNDKLDKGNKSCGEHYGVMDSKVSREVYCGQDEEYEKKILDLDSQLLKSDTSKIVGQDEKTSETGYNDRYKEAAEEIAQLINDDLSNSTGFDTAQIEKILRRRLGNRSPGDHGQKTGKDILGVKIPGTNFDLRINSPPEKIEMFAHSADCRYCNGPVKMMRHMKTFELQPNNCSCLGCGQRYFVKIPGTIEEWELKQWRQKGQTFVMGGDLSEQGKTVLAAESSENISNE